MSVAMPAQKGSTFSIAGRKISWDALLVAGAGVLGVVLLYRAGQPTSTGSATPTDTSGGGLSTLTDLGTLPIDPTQPAGSTPIAATGYQSFTPSGASPAVSSKPPSTAAAVTTSAPLNNYSPAYASSAHPVAQPPISGASLNIASALASVPILGSIVGQIAATPVVSTQPFNPVVPRSHGTQAV